MKNNVTFKIKSAHYNAKFSTMPDGHKTNSINATVRIEEPIQHTMKEVYVWMYFFETKV